MKSQVKICCFLYQILFCLTYSDVEKREADHSKPVITWSECGKCCALFARLWATGQGRFLCRPAGECQAEFMEPVANPCRGRHAIGAEAVRQRSPPVFMKNWSITVNEKHRINKNSFNFFMKMEEALCEARRPDPQGIAQGIVMEGGNVGIIDR